MNEDIFIFSQKTFGFEENFFLDGFMSITRDREGSSSGSANAYSNLFGLNRCRDYGYPDRGFIWL
jgi:hypothetical protein